MMMMMQKVMNIMMKMRLRADVAKLVLLPLMMIIVKMTMIVMDQKMMIKMVPLKSIIIMMTSTSVMTVEKDDYAKDDDGDSDAFFQNLMYISMLYKFTCVKRNTPSN